MNPTLGKDLLRSATAYGVGRTLLDILLIIDMAGWCVLGLIAYKTEALPWPPAAIAIAITLVIMVNWTAAVVAREVINSIFDIADAAAARHRADYFANARENSNPSVTRTLSGP